MKFYLVDYEGNKMPCDRSNAIDFLSSRQIDRLYSFERSEKSKTRYKVSFEKNLVYKYVEIERA